MNQKSVEILFSSMSFKNQHPTFKISELAPKLTEVISANFGVFVLVFDGEKEYLEKIKVEGF